MDTRLHSSAIVYTRSYCRDSTTVVYLASLSAIDHHVAASTKRELIQTQIGDGISNPNLHISYPRSFDRGGFDGGFVLRPIYIFCPIYGVCF